MDFIIKIAVLIILLFVLYLEPYKYRFIIVTGASSNHEISLIQFIYFCNKNEKNIRIVIWDLGFSNKFNTLIGYIAKTNKNIVILKFNFSKYPAFVNINKNKGQYAWKPIIINTTYYMMKGSLLWLDSGDIIINRLYKIFADINYYGCISIYSTGDIEKWTHIGMIKYYNITKSILRKRMCEGAIVGLKWNSKIANNVLDDWVNCALKRECIAPVGSNRKNHRQDQSVLSILMYKYNVISNCPYNNYNILTHKDLYNITQVNWYLNQLKAHK